MAQSPSTPTPVPPTPDEISQVVESVTRAANAFENMGFGISALVVIFVLVLLALVLVWTNRRNSTVVADTLSEANAEKATEIKAMRQERKEELQLIGNGVQLLSAILERMEKRSDERAQVEAGLATDVKTLVQEGSIPLRKMLHDVGSIMQRIDSLDTRTSSLPEIAMAIPAMRQEFNLKLDEIMREVLKRSTKPIPLVSVDVPVLPEQPTPPAEIPSEAAKNES